MKTQSNRQRSGQALVEYVLVLVMVVGATRIVLGFLPAQLRRIEDFMTQRYAASYRYGDQNTKGPDEGGYENHPRFINGTSFRLFKRSGSFGAAP